MMPLAENYRVGRSSDADIQRWVDILDRSEPHLSGWRSAFDRLKASLFGARDIRRILRYPLFALFAVVEPAHYFAGFASPLGAASGWLGAIGLGSLAALLIWELYVRHTFPVLRMEGRAVALLRYYGSTDVPHEQETY